MLGWFKKKFGKKEERVEDQVQLEPEQAREVQQPDPDPSQETQNKITEVEAPPSQPEQEANQAPSDQPVFEQPAPEESTIQLNVEDLEDPSTQTAPATSEETNDTVLPAQVEKDTPDESKTPQIEEPPEEEAQDTDSIAKEIEPAGSKDEEKKKDSLFSRLSSRLGKTKETFTYQMDALFLGKKEIDTDLLDSLEEILITADLGVETADELITYAKKKVKRKELSDPNALKDILKEQIRQHILASDADATLVMPDSGPFVIMVIGVNGVGKTTTIGKIAHKFKMSGSSVMLVAADTFRAAAVSQLQIWGERNDVPVVAQHEGADPSSVVFDALSSAVASETDVVIVDTAGRMHTKDNLMEELKKIKRVMGKKLRGAPHEIMLVIDATTGQNGISQARLFDAAVDITGLTLTKLDGTSKGGIVANICRDMKIPIRFIGIGEQMDDLRDFDATEFVDALFASD